MTTKAVARAKSSKSIETGFVFANVSYFVVLVEYMIVLTLVQRMVARDV